MISVNNLNFSYGKIQALKNINFNVEKGEIMVFIGANGAGKSTLMKCMAGFLKYKDGEIIYKGDKFPGNTYEVVERGITLVPEGRWIFPNLSVEENLTIGGYTRSRARTKENVSRMYELFPRLYERHNQRAGTLSGGEQQMLAIGRGLMSDPEVLLLDEPSLGLAPIIVNDIFKIIHSINKLGVTILLVEQNAKKALSIADRACLLETGKIIKSGSGTDMANDTDIVQAYLGGKKQKQPAKNNQ